MKRQRLTVLFVLVCLLMTGLVPVYANAPARSLPAAVVSGNLIVNGDAEAGAGSNTCGVVSVVPGWTTQGNFSVSQYDCDAYDGEQPGADTPGPANRGLNYFAGGPDNTASSATQTIDLSNYAAAIDTGNHAYTLSGWLGGWSDQNDNARLTINFKNAADQSLGTATLGPVTNAERSNLTALLYQTINGLVPALSRRVVVTLQMTRSGGVYNDGYADNLFLGLGLSSSSTIYLPLVLNNYCSTSMGINGRVSFNGAAAAGVSLQLLFYNGSTWSTYATKTTAADGTYSFTGAASLSSGQRYYVRFQNSTSGPDTQLWYWATRVLTSYPAGCDVGIGDFDIANVPQVSPSAYATEALPSTFLWTRRTATPSDSYVFELLLNPGSETSGIWSTQPLGYVATFALNSLPTGFSPGTQYGWEVRIYSPDGGQGTSRYYSPVTFSNTGNGSLQMSIDKTSRDLTEDASPNPSP
ncbi:MAG: hypothetical protein NTV38_11045 [Chloroflexi bacterium]|nr:hypothetical protein [Chloroflexota bacterium]